MTADTHGIALSNPHVRMLDSSKLKVFHISEAPEDEYQSYVRAQEAVLETRHSYAPDISNNRAYATFAVVKVDGKVVAEIDNHGFTKSSNALAGRIHQALQTADREAGALQGPRLAQARAARIAELLGGEVAISATAMTQAQFNAAAPVRPIVDHEAMKSDPLYQSLQKTREARTLFLAQQISQV